MNAGGVLNTCKSSEFQQLIVEVSGRRVSNTWAICPREGNNLPKGGLMSRKTTGWHHLGVKAPQGALEEEPEAYHGSWRGNGPPSL